MKLNEATIQDINAVALTRPRTIGFIVKKHGMPISYHPTLEDAEDCYRDQSSPDSPLPLSLSVEEHSLPHPLTLAYHLPTDTVHLFTSPVEGAPAFFGYSYSTLCRYAESGALFEDGWQFIPQLKAMFILESTLFSRKVSASKVSQILNTDIRKALTQAYKLTHATFPGKLATAVLVSQYHTEFIGNIPNVYSPLTTTPVLAEVPRSVAQCFSDNLKMQMASSIIKEDI
jgi:hypothetical protein